MSAPSPSSAAVEFLFDYASPWSFLADRLLSQHFGADLPALVPVYLRGFEAFSQGVPYSAAKLAYIVKDLERCAAEAGVAVSPKGSTTRP